MREILFRGKPLSKYPVLKQEHGWVYRVPIPIKIDAYETDCVEITKCDGYEELDGYELLSEDDEVDPKTVGQYTGLKDKMVRKSLRAILLKPSRDPLRWFVNTGRSSCTTNC